MSIEQLARPEIRALRPYFPATASGTSIRLNANESPAAVDSGLPQGLNRYPAVRPSGLATKLADYYGVTAGSILVTRGSSEGIDLLVRAFCRAGTDNVVLTPPVFELYDIYATVQGARRIAVPLQAENDFALDTEALLAACDDETKLIFLCSPNNPVGTAIPTEQIMKIVEARAGKSIVVVDEAYIEFSDRQSLANRVNTCDNLVVLRTLSKAMALAGARCGAVIAQPGLIALLDCILAPYAMSSPVISCIDRALSDQQLADAGRRIERVVSERDRVSAALATCNAVQYVWPSEANFLLVRFNNLQEVTKTLETVGIAIRTFADDDILKGCGRITISTAEENNVLVDAIRGIG